MLPAAREMDWHLCPQSQHYGGGVGVGEDRQVLANGVRQARGTDPAMCAGPADYIVTGSGTVLVCGEPAARMSDKTMHQGFVAFGSGNVFVGGPTVGVVLGGSDAAKRACANAAKGRRAGASRQSYENCAVEACRVVINKSRGSEHTEDQMLDEAMNRGYAERTKARRDSGGMSMLDEEKLLKDHGVDANLERLSRAELLQRIADRRGVITKHDAGELWNSPEDANQPHAVIPYAVEYGPDGRPRAVVVLDTGTGNCAERIPMAQFWSSLGWDPSMPDWPVLAVATRHPIW